jgi:hypothetical protein
MTAIRNLFAGWYPLWLVFWLIGLPVYAIHYIGVGCGLADPSGCDIGSLTLVWLVLVSGIGTLLIAIPIWRSASNYNGPRWRAILAYMYVGLTVVSAVPMSLVTASALVYHAFTGRS